MFTKIFVFITFFGLIFAVEISSTSSTTTNNSNVAVGDPGLKAFASFFENIGKLMSATAKDAEKVANDNSTTVEASDGTITADVDPKLKIVSSVFESFGKLMANAANETGGGGNETKIVGKINPFENLMEFFNNMAKLDKELKKMNLTMDDLKNVTWKNYTSGPLYELSKKEVFQNVFGDFSVNSTSFNYSTKIGEEFKPEDFQILMNGTNLDIKAEHTEKFGKDSSSTTKFTKTLPLPDKFSLKDIKYEFGHGKLFVCGDLRFECEITQNKPVPIEK